MKKLPIREVLAGTAVGSALLIGLAPAAAAESSCALVVVCTDGSPVDTAPPADPAPPPARQPEPRPAQTPPQPRSSAEVTADLLAMLNQERSSRGLPPFTRRDDVDRVAAAWSDRLADAGELSHNDAYFSEQSRRDHDGKALGENVARDAEAQSAHQNLMASPRHRDNILDARFTVVGLGATYRDGSWWITEDFLQPAAAPATREVARSVPGPPATTAPAPPAEVVASPAPIAEVQALTVTAASPRRLVTAPGLTTGRTSPLPLEGPGRNAPPPAATGLAIAGLCALAGLLVRRRALTIATS